MPFGKDELGDASFGRAALYPTAAQEDAKGLQS